MQAFLSSLFRNLDQANIHYCLLRDHERLGELKSGAEVDMLVQASQLAQVEQVLAHLGFVRLPNWGHAPHHFFVAYHQNTDSWLKVDITTEVAYGRTIAAIRTDLAGHCLNNRRRFGPTFAPAPECELVMLLLHCVLDKQKITPVHGNRLQTLRRQVDDEQYLSTLLADYWLPAMKWPAIAAYIDNENWAALVATHQSVAHRLVQRDWFGTQRRMISGRLLRKLNIYIHARRPPSLSVALLAPDGAGKSTLATGLQNTFCFPVRTLYMGLYQKGRRGKTHVDLPGLGFVQRLAGQWGRYLKARYYQMRGQLVIFDRYTYDAWLPTRQRLSLLKQGRRWLLAHSCPPPNLVFLLDAPGQVLHARKGEHTVEILEQQRQSYLRLRPHLPQMIVLDATKDTEQVRREAIALIWDAYLRRQAGLQIMPKTERSQTHVEGSVNF